MDREEVKKEIKNAFSANSENHLVEFKSGKGGFPTRKTLHTLSAFGNVQGGGIIAFGIKESEDRTLNVVGVDDSADFQEKMSNLAASEMNVVLRLDYYGYKFDGKNVLAVYIPECRNHEKPYHIKNLGMHRGAYIREGNTDRRMTEDEVRSYVRNAQGDDYDVSCTRDLQLSDLSEEKIRIFLDKSAEKIERDIESSQGYQEVLQNIGILKECDDILRPTLAGYLIFANQTPQQVLEFERYMVRCVRYQGSGVQSDIIDSADIEGTLDEQIDGMQNFILRNIKKSAQIVGTKRVDRYEYPEKAIREIVANAVIHRNYRITETYTQVNVFEDRIEVFNPGNLPPGVTVENIRDSQVSRNKVIAARLKDLDYLEEYGRGINIVFTEMNKWGLLPPIFKNTSNSFRVILPGERLSTLNDRQLRIWEHLVENGQITRKKAEELLEGVSQPTVSSDIRKLREKGLVIQQGESRNTYYEPSF